MLRLQSVKGSDIASIDLVTGQMVGLFNPRTQRWSEHFRLQEDGRIVPLTAVGRVTETLLRLNLPDRLEVRANLNGAGRVLVTLTH